MDLGIFSRCGQNASQPVRTDPVAELRGAVDHGVRRRAGRPQRDRTTEPCRASVSAQAGALRFASKQKRRTAVGHTALHSFLNRGMRARSHGHPHCACRSGSCWVSLPQPPPPGSAAAQGLTPHATGVVAECVGFSHRQATRGWVGHGKGNRAREKAAVQPSHTHIFTHTHRDRGADTRHPSRSSSAPLRNGTSRQRSKRACEVAGRGAVAAETRKTEVLESWQQLKKANGGDTKDLQKK